MRCYVVLIVNSGYFEHIVAVFRSKLKAEQYVAELEAKNTFYGQFRIDESTLR